MDQYLPSVVIFNPTKKTLSDYTDVDHVKFEQYAIVKIKEKLG